MYLFDHYLLLSEELKKYIKNCSVSVALQHPRVMRELARLAICYDRTALTGFRTGGRYIS